MPIQKEDREAVQVLENYVARLLDQVESLKLNGAEMRSVNKDLFKMIANVQEDEETAKEALKATKSENTQLQGQVDRLVQELHRSEG